ncbi:MAG: MBL fold metallo-hydrolase [Ekhidna sp.]|nr:MBL fold metallo-hydrolase [Ekhidna sp.]MBC6410294.1 MBL fold metallo-hydrolase [Ekhidna sp.]MBC6425089.1 MBL fold metallo-hydrolase [Ekhidna sp.]
MKVTFLGTGTSQGVPVIGCKCKVCTSIDYHDNRLRSSVFIEYQGIHLIIDTGPDFRQQMLRERISHLNAVLFTHEHKDHTAGLDDIRSYNFLQRANMPVYGRERVLNQLQREFAYIFNEKKYPGVPSVSLNEIHNKPFKVSKIDVTPIEVLHYKLPVFGFRIADFTYITDANFIAEEEKEKIKGSKIIVLNALQKDDHISHFTFDEAVSLMEELKPEKGYFTHISHKLGLHAEVSEELPDFIELAWDGLRITSDD